MIKHKKVYINFFDYAENDWIGCEGCGATATEIHHLQFKSKQGKDVIENLCAVCRECHNLVHNIDPSYNNILKEKHRNKLDAWKNTTGK
jgi:5-methylcytosine-specific restriction endonuclease McrA